MILLGKNETITSGSYSIPISAKIPGPERLCDKPSTQS